MMLRSGRFDSQVSRPANAHLVDADAARQGGSIVAAQDAFIKVENLAKSFEIRSQRTFSSVFTNGPLVLSEINLQVKPLEFISIVGPSGCGKSTFLNILAGLIPPSSGLVTIDGDRIRRSRDRTSMVFQSPSLMDWKTVHDNVALALRLRNHRRLTASDHERVDHYLQLVELPGHGGYYPSKISGGMQQRVGIARALVTEPDLLLMDEPFGALDAQTRFVLQEELQKICEVYRATVVFVTHDIEEAAYLADRLVVLGANPGRIVEILDVPFPRPRYEYDLRADADFNELRSHVLRRIRQSG